MLVDNLSLTPRSTAEVVPPLAKDLPAALQGNPGAWPAPAATWPNAVRLEAPAAPVAADAEPVGGAAWVAASRFQTLNDAEVTARVLSAVQRQARLAAAGQGPAPVVVFDLDYTIYNNDPRILAVLREWADSPAAEAFAAQRDAIRRGVEPRYDIGATLKTGGLNDEQVAACKGSILEYFKKAFFDDAHTLLDVPYPGAKELVDQLIAAGAKIVFLTGRVEGQQGHGTREALARDGLEVDGRDRFVILKASEKDASGKRIPDDVFKAQSGPTIAAIGQVVATYDNEPANVLALSGLYPNATNVFVNTRYTDTPVRRGDGLYKVDRFVTAPRR